MLPLTYNLHTYKYTTSILHVIMILQKIRLYRNCLERTFNTNKPKVRDQTWLIRQAFLRHLCLGHHLNLVYRLLQSLVPPLPQRDQVAIGLRYFAARIHPIPLLHAFTLRNTDGRLGIRTTGETTKGL